MALNMSADQSLGRPMGTYAARPQRPGAPAAGTTIQCWSVEQRYRLPAAEPKKAPAGARRCAVVQRAIGLADLFGLDQWGAGGARAPSGAVQTTANTSAAFEGLRNAGQIDAAQLVTQIPAGTANSFEIESRTQRGFKYDWNDLNGVAWRVWGHEPDAGAAHGHVGAAGWTVRIRRGANQFLMAQTINPPVGAPYDWAVPNTPAKVAASHIPLINV